MIVTAVAGMLINHFFSFDFVAFMSDVMSDYQRSARRRKVSLSSSDMPAWL